MTLQTLLVVLVNCLDRFQPAQSLLDTDAVGDLVAAMLTPAGPRDASTGPVFALQPHSPVLGAALAPPLHGCVVGGGARGRVEALASADCGPH